MQRRHVARAVEEDFAAFEARVRARAESAGWVPREVDAALVYSRRMSAQGRGADYLTTYGLPPGPVNLITHYVIGVLLYRDARDVLAVLAEVKAEVG